MPAHHDLVIPPESGPGLSFQSRLLGDAERDHPLLLELSTLRSSLRKFQHVAHSSSMQLQSKVMELMLANEERDRVKRESQMLRDEVEAYRKSTPDSPFPPATSQALAELTLAHRRLSSKCDHMQEAYQESQKELAAKTSECAMLKKERDTMGAIVQDWKGRVAQSENDKEAERSRRVNLEQQLKEAQAQLAQGKDPLEEQGLPESQDKLSTVMNDMEIKLSTSMAKIAELTTTIDELGAAKEIAQENEVDTREKLAKAQAEIEMTHADNHGAGQIVERYM